MKYIHFIVGAALSCFSFIGQVNGQTDAQVESFAADFSKALKKEDFKFLSSYSLTDENFEKYLMPTFSNMLEGEDNDQFLQEIRAEMAQIQLEYEAKFNAMLVELKNEGLSGPYTYLHFNIAGFREAELGDLGTSNIALVYMLKTGQKLTFLFNKSLISADKPIVGPDFKYLLTDVRHACSCLMGIEYLDDSVFGSFIGDCAYLNDQDLLYDVAAICGVDVYGEEPGDYPEYAEDPYESVDLCECKNYFNAYAEQMAAALNIQNEEERNHALMDVNYEWYYSLSDCKDKEYMIIESEGKEGLQRLMEECGK